MAVCAVSTKSADDSADHVNTGFTILGLNTDANNTKVQLAQSWNDDKCEERQLEEVRVICLSGRIAARKSSFLRPQYLQHILFPYV